MDKPVKLKYQRILLKLSGEALQSEETLGIDPKKLSRVSEEIANVVKLGVQLGIVIGAGNFIRGADLSATGFDRITADQMGMLATIINGLAIRDGLIKKSIPVEIMSAIAVPGLVDFFDRTKAKEHLQKGKVLLFVGGTGNPLVTTDTAAALRGVEIGADILLKATKVDGVFSADPIKHPKSQRYTSLSYEDVLEQQLGVMDLNAILICKNNGLPLRVFNMNNPHALQHIVQGDDVGTLIKSGE